MLGSFGLLTLSAIVTAAPYAEAAATHSVSPFGGHWSGAIRDNFAGTGRLTIDFYSSDRAGIDGTWHATFGDQRSNDEGTLTNLSGLGPAALTPRCTRDQLTNALSCTGGGAKPAPGAPDRWTFILVPSAANACTYTVAATIGGDGHLRGRYYSDDRCTKNSGSLDLTERSP